LVVLERPLGALWVRAWDRRGEPMTPSPDAALCAARLAFDKGLASREGVELRTGPEAIKVDAIDSRSLGVTLGPPASLSGDPFVETDGAREVTVVEAGGRRVEILPLRAAGLSWAVVTTGERPRSALEWLRGSAALTPLAVRMIDRSSMLAAARGPDALAAAGAALAAARARGLCEREAAVRFGPDAVWTRWNADGTLYAAASPAYAFSGELWQAD
ncbi:MAG: hypothetical protein JXA15_02875, partial [Spirochaetales bacterium]|nr:hypothetical protein [Spirochaetales bacterium]